MKNEKLLEEQEQRLELAALLNGSGHPRGEIVASFVLCQDQQADTTARALLDKSQADAERILEMARDSEGRNLQDIIDSVLPVHKPQTSEGRDCEACAERLRVWNRTTTLVMDSKRAQIQQDTKDARLISIISDEKNEIVSMIADSTSISTTEEMKKARQALKKLKQEKADTAKIQILEKYIAGQDHRKGIMREGKILGRTIVWRKCDELAKEFKLTKLIQKKDKVSTRVLEEEKQAHQTEALFDEVDKGILLDYMRRMPQEQLYTKILDRLGTENASKLIYE